MSEEPRRTFTALQIIEEFFPATPRHSRPAPRRYRLEHDDGGDVLVLDGDGETLLRLTPVPPAGNPKQRLCCDLCHVTAGREAMTLLRSEVPGSQGRRFRYLTACRDNDSCDARRVGDVVVERLLAD
ncbi:MAG: hypothetical protein R6W77_09715 [Trueperaceae bacterium]